jgi:hypothetical protein
MLLGRRTEEKTTLEVGKNLANVQNKSHAWTQAQKNPGLVLGFI